MPCVRHAANDGAEHEGRDEGEEDEVDEAFQSVVTHARDGLDVVLRGGENDACSKDLLWRRRAGGARSGEMVFLYLFKATKRGVSLCL